MRNRAIALWLGAFFTSFLISRTLLISLAIACVTTAMFVIGARRAVSKREWELFQAIPEIIDHVISGIQSGLSLNESLINLGTRGPVISQEIFIQFRDQMHQGEKFENTLHSLQKEFSLRAADQLFEALFFAKSLGGSELLSLLRQLGDFTRQDFSLRREISAKQQWVRNSAHLSAGAPWILLLLLSAQPATSKAFTTTEGGFILLCGMTMTVIAYLWMGKLSELPEPRRVFGFHREN